MTEGTATVSGCREGRTTEGVPAESRLAVDYRGPYAVHPTVVGNAFMHSAAGINPCPTNISSKKNTSNISQNAKEVLPMNKYEKPQFEIKSLVQTVAITAEDEDEGSVSVTIPGSWWPF